MTVLDIRMEIAQQIESIPDSEQTLLKVLQYVRKLAGKGDVSLNLTGDALRLWNRVEELKLLKKSWDGADAMPIEKKAIANLQKVLKQGVSADFRDWVLFPDEAGTLLLQSRDGKASISVGNNSFSYVYEKDGKILSGDKVRFATSSLLSVIRKIVA
jgi:hypothetical protein